MGKSGGLKNDWCSTHTVKCMDDVLFWLNIEFDSRGTAFSSANHDKVKCVVGHFGETLSLCFKTSSREKHFK